METSLTDRTLVELAGAIAAGEVSSREAVDAHISRIEAVDPALNAVTMRLYDRAREAAAAADERAAAGGDLRALHGVPVSIKEQFLVADTPCTWGKPSRAGHSADREGPLLHRLRNAGAIPLVRTNVPMLLLETETHNPLYGRTNNPWNLQRTPGGSSGGEAALIAARGSPLGLGADIGGSLRVPAHFCGLSTLMSTPKRLPWGDNPQDTFPDWQEAITPVPGPLARTVGDVRLAMEVLADGHDPLPPEPGVPPLDWPDPGRVDLEGLRVGVVTSDRLFPTAPAVRRAIDEAAGALQDAGADVGPATVPDGDEIVRLYAGLLGGDRWGHARDQLGDDPPSQVLQLLFLAGRAPAPLSRLLARLARLLGQRGAATVLDATNSGTAYEYGEALIRRDELARRMAEQFHGGPSVLLAPPQTLPAFTHGAFRDLLISAWPTFLTNLMRLPAGTVPVTRVRPGEESDRSPGVDVIQRLGRRVEAGSAGLPVGVQVIGPWWREDLILAAMGAVEQGVDGVGAPPDVG